MEVIEILKKEEGFRGYVYVDTEGYDTIGYGTKMPITEEEAELLLRHRFNIIKKEVEEELSFLVIEDNAWQVLYLMAYQMGLGGLLKFKNMIKALESQHYEIAAKEMLDSRWARQTPGRANRMADMMRKVQ